MKKLTTALLLTLGLAGVAHAQEFSADPYEFLMAKLAAEDGKYDEALSRLDKIIANHPNSGVLYYERAMVLIDASRMDRAETELQHAITVSPDLYDAQRVLGRLELERAATDKSKLDEALVHLQAAYKLNPDDLSTGMAIAQVMLSNNRVADAEKVLASLLERAPDQRSLNYTYAQVLTKTGRADQARPYLERAVVSDPTFGPAILQLIDVYQKTGEWQKAADVLQPLINEDPSNSELQKQQAFFYLRANMPEKARASFSTLAAADPKDTRSQFYLAESLSDLERYPEAESIYRKLLEKTPDDTDLLASFGLTLAAERKYDEASHTFQTLLTLPGVLPSVVTLAKTQLAYIDLQQGKYDSALSQAREVMVLREKANTQAVNIAAEALKHEKRDAEAVTLLAPLAARYPNDAVVNARYIEAVLRSGEKTKAAELANAQAKLGVRNAIGAAEALINGGEGSAAVTMLRREVAANSDDPDLQYELGTAYDRAGDRASSEKVFLALLEKHPDHAGSLNYLGYMWAESGTNLDRAAELLTHAVTLEPRNGAYIDSLGWIYFRQGKLELAEKYLTDASTLLPRDATVHEHLGDVLAKRGSVAKALDAYRAALTLDASKDDAKLRAKIADLEKQKR